MDLPPDLDALLPAAQQFANAKHDLKRAQRLIRAFPAGSPEQSEASAIARRLLAALEWRDIAIVALMLEQVCLDCGRVHFWFEGEYLERHHLRDVTAKWQELIPNPQHYPHLPKRIEYRTHKVRMCPSCVREHGYE